MSSPLLYSLSPSDSVSSALFYSPSHAFFTQPSFLSFNLCHLPLIVHHPSPNAISFPPLQAAFISYTFLYPLTLFIPPHAPSVFPITPYLISPTPPFLFHIPSPFYIMSSFFFISYQPLPFILLPCLSSSFWSSLGASKIMTPQIVSEKKTTLYTMNMLLSQHRCLLMMKCQRSFNNHKSSSSVVVIHYMNSFYPSIQYILHSKNLSCCYP